MLKTKKPLKETEKDWDTKAKVTAKKGLWSTTRRSFFGDIWWEENYHADDAVKVPRINFGDNREDQFAFPSVSQRFKLTPYDLLLFEEYIKNNENGFLQLVTSNPNIVASQIEENIPFSEETKILLEKYVESYPYYTPSVYFNALHIAKYNTSKVQQFLRDDEKKRLTSLFKNYQIFFRETYSTLEDYLELIDTAYRVAKLQKNESDIQMLRVDKQKIHELLQKLEAKYEILKNAHLNNDSSLIESTSHDMQELMSQMIYYVLSINMWSVVEGTLNGTFDINEFESQEPQFISNLYEDVDESTMTDDTIMAILITRRNMLTLDEKNLKSINSYLSSVVDPSKIISKKALYQLQYEKSLLERMIEKNNSQIKNFEIVLSKRGVPHTLVLFSSSTKANLHPPPPFISLMQARSVGSNPSLTSRNQHAITPVKKVSTEQLHNRIKKIISDSIRKRVHIGGGYKKSRKLKLNRNKMSRKYNKMSRKYNKMSRKSKTNK